MRMPNYLALVLMILSVGIMATSPGVANADVQFELQGSLTQANLPFTSSDPVSGFVSVVNSAAAAGNVSTNPLDIVAYSFTIGDETWSGTGADFLGIFGFEISVDGQELFFKSAGGGLQSSPSGFYLDIVTNVPNPTEWIISNGLLDQIAAALGTMQFVIPTSSPCQPVTCPGTGGAVFSLSGSLTSTSLPFSPSDPVFGCIRVTAGAAAAGNVSTNPADILAYSFTIGDETWSGTGADFLGIFEFEISVDGQELFFKSAGGGLQSAPSGFYLDIVTNVPNPTKWIISNGLLDQIAAAVGTMSFCLVEEPLPVEETTWGSIKTRYDK